MLGAVTRLVTADQKNGKIFEADTVFDFSIPKTSKVYQDLDPRREFVAGKRTNLFVVGIP